MRALRKPDEPYPLHGSEVAIRYCSPTNGASRVSPSTFATYLAEPHYQILTEWDEMEIEDDGECSLDTNSCDVRPLVSTTLSLACCLSSQRALRACLVLTQRSLDRRRPPQVDVLVKRSDDDSYTVVNWVLSRHNGRWLTDSLTIN